MEDSQLFVPTPSFHPIYTQSRFSMGAPNCSIRREQVAELLGAAWGSYRLLSGDWGEKSPFMILGLDVVFP